jgi:hypothetical protein
MKYVASKEHIVRKLEKLEFEEKLALKELLERISGLSCELNVLRKDKLNALDSFDADRTSRLENADYNISRLWQELKNLEKERLRISAHFGPEKRKLKQMLEDASNIIIENFLDKY